MIELSPKQFQSTISSFRHIVFDFDGVIKDSLEAKAEAFCSLFPNSPETLHESIRNHHYSHGGVSRYKKLPIYCNLAGITPTPELINQFTRDLERLMINRVVDSPWVPGALQLITNASVHHNLYILSATPQREIEAITNRLQIGHYFTQIIGSPADKTDYLKRLSHRYPGQNSICFIGDSYSDASASFGANIPFIFRRHTKNLMTSLDCYVVPNLVSG